MAETCVCIEIAAYAALAAFGKIAIASSPIVLTIRPPCSSQICRITSSARPIVASASASPSVSYNLVLPAMSANRIAACRWAGAWVMRFGGVAAAEYRGSERTGGSLGRCPRGWASTRTFALRDADDGLCRARAAQYPRGGAGTTSRPARTKDQRWNDSDAI